MMQLCTHCKIEKPFTEFHKDKGKLYGFHTNCKTCKNIGVSKSMYKYKNTEHGLLQLKIAEIYTPSTIDTTTQCAQSYTHTRITPSSSRAPK